MAVYTIVVKKGNLEYSLSSDDKLFVADYISRVFCDVKSNLQSNNSELFSALKIENTPNPSQNDLVSREEQNISSADTEQKLVEEKEQDEVKEVFETDNLVSKIVAASAESIEQVEESKEQQLQSFIENVFVPRDTKKELPTQTETEEDQPVASSFDFANILAEKLKTPLNPEEAVYADAEPTQEDYDSFLKNKSPESLIDYLVITAYYMFENEGVERFAVKQLNQKLFSSMKLLIDNKTAQNAVEQGFIEIVSEFSANGVTEYALTEFGRNYYINGFK